MKIVNIHTRLIEQPKSKIDELLLTLATENDKVWPTEKWPPMRFKKGLMVGSKGGHGPIRYKVEKIEEGKLIYFRFTKPKGFRGFHSFEINEMSENQTQLKHTIDMSTDFEASLLWVMGIRWLHDALLEDAFDKVENQFLSMPKYSKWSLWVRFLRKILK